ncbi:MAG: hypothetical protein OXF07_05325 [Rhodobacter sp.]|nr:hypothetical protein [Rhodobacter sp.]MCY4167521.1 hypothetical protein [Rhodobacter sp.]MCY4240921.1 hypothetical protein [Rhodobacter sp.]
MYVLRLAARHGRVLLVIGLTAGFALPELSTGLKPALPAIVVFLVFISAMRIGVGAALGSLRDARQDLVRVLALQLAVPCVLALGLVAAGLHGSAAGAALVLAMAAPSISGSPAFTVMLGHDPAPAMRLLVIGTALLPLTVIPVFSLLPTLGGSSDVADAALRLTLTIAFATGIAFAVRQWLFPDPGPETVHALDGLAALTLAVIVIGLMAAVGPTLRDDPMALVGWLSLAFLASFGMQAAARALGAKVATAIVAGNRNIALFLVALPAGVTDSLLTFIGCYQVPMYLTPILMRRYYDRG